MHTKTLYKHDREGHVCKDTPIAHVTVDDDALFEVRMLDGSVLISAPLEVVAYMLMWYDYPAIRQYVPHRGDTRI